MSIDSRCTALLLLHDFSHIVWYEAVTIGRPQVPEKDQQVRDNKVYPSEVRIYSYSYLMRTFKDAHVELIIRVP